MELSIQAQPRTVDGRQNIKLRKQGIIPAVLYGRARENMSLQLPRKEFDRIYRQAGENTLVNLKIDGKGETKVLIHDVAKHFMKDEPVHVDFYEVDLTRKIRAKVPLEFTGVAPAVKELGGILVKNISEVEVESLPAELPHSISVSIETLKTFEDVIRLSDVKISGNVKVLGNMEEAVVSVQPPRSEEELANLAQPSAEAEKAAVEAMNAEAAKEKEVKAAEGETKEVKAEAKEEKKK